MVASTNFPCWDNIFHGYFERWRFGALEEGHDRYNEGLCHYDLTEIRQFPHRVKRQFVWDRPEVPYANSQECF